MAKKQPASKPISKRKNVLGDPARLKKLLQLAESLPEVVVELVGEQHLAFKVRKKTLAWYLDSHHGDGIVCLCAKSTLARQAELVAAHPDRYLVPAYVGHQGWVSLRLDQPDLDWGEVTALLLAAYRMQAPKKLVDEI
jgi:phosphoribosylglycinamide formyltransferase-1